MAYQYNRIAAQALSITKIPFFEKLNPINKTLGSAFPKKDIFKTQELEINHRN